MLEVTHLLLPLIGALWWPFCRIMALLSTAPAIGDAAVPVTVRVLLSVVLAFLMLPLTQGGAMPDPFSLAGVLAMAEQAVIGGVIGLAMQLTMAVVNMLGFLASSQIGFSMAQINDPINGQQSDVITALLGLVATLVFFSVDGHLVLAGVLGQSFRAWPVGAGQGPMLLQAVALNVGWVFSAAILLALPIVFSTLVVQIGFGFLNRVAPSLNLFSLGFSLVTVFGLMMLVQVVRFVPEHYVQMTNRVLEMIQQQMRLR
ncbi:flagellar biosynthetic protein FliR [Massilia sp. 9096]|uniref:flagellar biosynthetic protein FliR n=1 Tax=Massilia sp. 9096 TaxID=1500894 RepID=UPI00056BFB49|nr:flagellar biosynthetic protein FliR [Massilia sp. 9096]